MKPFRPLAVLAALAIGTVAVAGADPAEPAAAARDSAPTTVVASPSPSTTVPTVAPIVPPPTKIVSLSPSATEMLFAIGAGPQVIAVDEYSNYPAETQNIRHDLSGFQPNVEMIAALAPDLVIHDGTTKLHDQLGALKIRDFAAMAPSDLAGVYTQIEQLGVLTGHVGEAAELVSKMSTDIERIVAGAAKVPNATYFHELDSTLYSVTSRSVIGNIYSRFGMTNIADAAGADTAYPQLSAEAVIKANPTVIFLADAVSGESAETVAKRPGWDAIDAVRNGKIVALPADVPSRWGPRLVDFAQVVADALATLPGAVPASSLLATVPSSVPVTVAG